MKVGDRIRVFEVTRQYECLLAIIGIQRPEINNSGLNDGVPMLLTNDILGADLHFLDEKANGFDDECDCKHVATMVITKLK